MKFKTQFNGPHPPMGEINRLPSATVPDQTMSIKEILDRHSRGLPISAGKVPIFDDSEEYFPDPSKMDLADREAYADLLREQYDEIQENLRATKKAQDDARAKAAAEAKQEKAFLKRLKEKQRNEVTDIDPESES